MPDLKYLYCVLFIAFLNKLLIYFFTNLTIKSQIHLKDLEISKYKRFFSLEQDLEISKYKRESKGR
jgi:hypothetical protein